MATHSDSRPSADVPAPSSVVPKIYIPQPTQLYSKTADEIYDLVGVPGDKRADIIQCARIVYGENNFPDLAFQQVPEGIRLVAKAAFETGISTIYPELAASWFADWALWWEHTEPVAKPKGPDSSIKRGDVYSLLRVDDPTRNLIIACIGDVYKKGNFGDARFSSLPKDRVAELGLELTVELREVFPDARRGEPWFGPLSLFKRHKTRAESRKRKKKVESVAGGSGH